MFNISYANNGFSFNICTRYSLYVHYTGVAFVYYFISYAKINLNIFVRQYEGSLLSQTCTGFRTVFNRPQDLSDRQMRNCEIACTETKVPHGTISLLRRELNLYSLENTESISVRCSLLRKHVRNRKNCRSDRKIERNNKDI